MTHRDEDPKGTPPNTSSPSEATEAVESMEATEASAPAEEQRESDPTARLLRRALETPPPPHKSFLPSIQERIRRRTRGRYFRDRWSRSRDPIPLLMVLALIVLILAAAVFLVLQPLMGEAESVKMPDAPVDPLEAPNDN